MTTQVKFQMKNIFFSIIAEFPHFDKWLMETLKNTSTLKLYCPNTRIGTSLI